MDDTVNQSAPGSRALGAGGRLRAGSTRLRLFFALLVDEGGQELGYLLLTGGGLV